MQLMHTPISVRDKFAHFSWAPGRTMQQFLQQEDMRSVVHFAQECLCILLSDNVAASARTIHHLFQPFRAGLDVKFPSFLECLQLWHQCLLRK